MCSIELVNQVAILRRLSLPSAFEAQSDCGSDDASPAFLIVPFITKYGCKCGAQMPIRVYISCPPYGCCAPALRSSYIVLDVAQFHEACSLRC